MNSSFIKNISILALVVFFSCCWGSAVFAIDFIEINNDYYAQGMNSVEDVFARLREADSAAKIVTTLEQTESVAAVEEKSFPKNKNPFLASKAEDMESVMRALAQREKEAARAGANPQESLAALEHAKGLGAEQGSAPAQVALTQTENKKIAEELAEVPAEEEPLPPSERPSSLKERKLFRTKIGVKEGYRRDNLHWSIAGTSAGSSPNILSELTWSDMQMYEVKGEAKVVLKDFVRLEGSYAYGWVNDGRNQDSDYLGDDRTGEFSRSNNRSNGDHVQDYSLGAGFEFPIHAAPVLDTLGSDKMVLALLGGYSESKQDFRMTDGYQTIPATGSFANLDSSYKARWRGPWAGAELSGEKGKWDALLRGEYHWARYYGEGNWNLRSDFRHPRSFEHITEAGGVHLLLGLAYALTPSWRLGLDYEGKMMNAGAGVDRTFFSNGTQSETRFNESIWNSYSVRLGATYLFP